MDSAPDSTPWLETMDGEKIPLEGSCTMGRSRANQVVLPDQRVSRKHAVIHPQGKGEFCMVDLGTMNGTRINGRRIFLPTYLHDADEIDIAGVKLVFRMPAPATGKGTQFTTTAATIREIRRYECWLLVVDIVSSTRLHQTLPTDQVPILLGRWFAALKDIIEGQQGAINQFTGDGVFAVWLEPPERDVQLHALLASLRQLQQQGEPAFRFVLHRGSVSIAPSPQPGHESLMGNDVHYTFRMEELAKSLGLTAMLSEPAATRFAPQIGLQHIGRHTLRKFDGDFLFYGFPS